MTASVVVMNSGGVALATDSAVTIPYERTTKHYKGACKLVALHAEAPVAVLWYGSPDYLGVPWEVIVKDYRESAPGTLPRLPDYAKDFLEYLDTKLPLWAPSGNDEPAASALVRDLIAKVEISLSGGVGEPAEVVSKEIADWTTSLKPRKRVLGDEQIDGCKPLWKWLEGELDRLDKITGGPLPGEVRESLRQAARSAWSRLSTREPLHTGLVFAGFGDDDQLPSMCSYLVGVPVEGTPRRADGQKATVSAKEPAVIVPFAQNDEVKLFMEGVHPNLRKLIGSMLGELNEQQMALVPNVARMERVLNDYIDGHGRPVVDAVRFLPKADLAEFARTLISFTAFRLRMSMSPETVGEPIDVAVVSRSEGLVWIHRSHYFPAALNPHFFGRYRL